MFDFFKILGLTILGLAALGVVALLWVFILTLLWPLFIIALPLALIIYFGSVVYKLNQKEQKNKKRSKK